MPHKNRKTLKSARRARSRQGRAQWHGRAIQHGHAARHGVAMPLFWPRTAVRRWNFGIYCQVSTYFEDSFIWGFKSSSIRVSLSLSQTPLGGNKLG